MNINHEKFEDFVKILRLSEELVPLLTKYIEEDDVFEVLHKLLRSVANNVFGNKWIWDEEWYEPIPPDAPTFAFIVQIGDEIYAVSHYGIIKQDDPETVEFYKQRIQELN